MAKKRRRLATVSGASKKDGSWGLDPNHQHALDTASLRWVSGCNHFGLRGFILVQVRLSRIVHFHDAGQSENNQLIVTFEMDREMFHHLIADFGELAAQVKDDPFGQE